MLVAVLVLGLALPQVAGAAITSTRWSETSYSGYDSFYASNVVAYEAGSEAELVVSVQNTSGTEMIVKEAKVKFDWGSEYAVTSPAVPFRIKPGETKIVNFVFTVPGLDTATNQALHRYDVYIGFQYEGTNYVRNSVRWSTVSNTANPSEFQLSNNRVLDTRTQGKSVVLYKVTGGSPGTVAVAALSEYTVDELTGKITIPGGIAAGVQLYADYRYFEMASAGGWGDGVNTVFYTQQSPIVSDSLVVALENSVVNTFTKMTAGTDYTVDADSGRVVFVTAPTSYERVWFTYEYYARWTTSGTTFAVYSADQADARELKSQLNVLGWFGSSPEGNQLMQEAAIEEQLGDTAYSSGNFADAKTRYENALSKTMDALEADTANAQGYNDAMLGLATGGASILDAVGAKFDAEAKRTEALVDAEKAKIEAEADKLSAEASKASSYGLFLILIGAGGIIASIGGVLWAASRLVAARRM